MFVSATAQQLAARQESLQAEAREVIRLLQEAGLFAEVGRLLATAASSPG